ncbi:hypothetical protein AK51_33340, partial [Serratia nematodiphila DZ0503SBS1]
KLIIAAVLAGISVSASAAETIRFATEASYPPFEFIDAGNKIQGLMSIWPTRCAKKCRPECTFTNQAFRQPDPEPEVQAFDAVMAGDGQLRREL